jgi:uncharacterized Zn finger protein (UPF0148 family)
MQTEVTNFPCPACNAPLQYSEKTGKLQCEYCDSSFTIEEMDALYRDKENKKEKQEIPPEENWDTSGLSSDWGEEAQQLTAYNCPSCGAQLICEETTAATHCPYCGNPSIVPGKLEGALRPDYVLPFEISKEQALAKLKDHFKKKPFLPSPFLDKHQLEKTQGVYVPFWLFDGQVSGNCTYHATRILVTRRGDTEITTTQHYMVLRGGEIAFEKVPVDGSTKMSDAHMDAIEPFDYSRLKPFSVSYLPGFLADRYDVTAEDSRARADSRCENSFDAALQATILGYNSCIRHQHDVKLNRGKVSYALLPVWLMHVKWEGKDYLFAVNGQSGKLAGDLPVCKKKVAAWFGAVTAALGVLGSLLVPLLFG